MARLGNAAAGAAMVGPGGDAVNAVNAALQDRAAGTQSVREVP